MRPGSGGHFRMPKKGRQSFRSLGKIDSRSFDLDRRARSELIEGLGLKKFSTDDGFVRIIRFAAKRLRAVGAVLCFSDGESSFLKCHTGLEPWLESSDVLPGGFPCNRIIHSREVFRVSDLSMARGVQLTPKTLNEEIKGFLGCPVMSPEGFMVACIGVFDTKVREWNEQEISLLIEMAGMVTQEMGLLASDTEETQTSVATPVVEDVHEWLGQSDCLVWQATVTLGEDDWSWQFHFLPSGLFKRLTGELLPPPNRGLWYRFNIPEQEEMNRRSRDAILGRKGGYQQEFRVIGEHGTVWIKEDVKITPLTDNTSRLVGVVTDVTGIKKREFKLQQARDDALKRESKKTEFLANMSHEIRTPMNGIIGMASLLHSESLTQEQHHMNSLVIQSAQSLLGVVNDVLDLSKIDSRKLKIGNEKFSFDALIRDLCEMFSVQAREKGIAFEHHVDASLSVHFYGDSTRIRQVLNNLLGNAMKFTDEGSVTLEVTSEPAEGGKLMVRMLVKDTGIGIDWDFQKRLFQPFEQVNLSDDDSREGTGLGLTITKNLVELMGGRIEFESIFGQGSVFWVDIPLAPAETDSKSNGRNHPKLTTFANKVRPSKTAKRLDSGNEPRKSVLVVDDNTTNRKVVQLVAKGIGLGVSTAASGRECLEMLRHSRFDAVIMDCQMPGMDGFETTLRIRGHEVENVPADIPIIAFTARAMKEDREKCLKCGMTEYLTKPATKEEILDVMQKVGLFS